MKKIILLLCFSLSLLKADQYAFRFYNDLFANRDQYFTNGVAFSWIDDRFGDENESQQTKYSDNVYKLFDSVTFRVFDPLKNHNAGISIAQYMFTPQETNVTEPQYNDFPYAGYLALDFFLFEWDSDSLREYRIEFGVVGKESGAEWMQKKTHKITGSDTPQGWGTQLGTQYTINALFRYGEISWQKSKWHGMEMDWCNQVGFQVGNFMTNVFVGSTFRIGHNYVQNFNIHYPYLKEDAAYIRKNAKQKGFGYAFSLGLDMEANGYTYILDEAKKEGYNLDKKIAVLSAYTDVSMSYYAHHFTFFYQTYSPYAYQKNGFNIFGGFSYVYQF